MKADITPIRVAPYARISDTDEERAPGLDRQLRTIMPLILNRDGVATHEYIDNDKSAYKPEVIRDEGFEPWLADFIAGKNDGIAGWDLDRIFRQLTDLERVIAAYKRAYFVERRPKPVLWLPSASIDLTDEDGQFMARVLVSAANQSSGKTVKRVTNFYRDEALKGKGVALVE
ncbi:MAG TPA: recombinase family protein [Actinocrinis sp.]|nr:recombinase family protein [Actinocrinis sp.]